MYTITGISEQSSKFPHNISNESEGSEKVNENAIKMLTTAKHDDTTLQPPLNDVNVQAQVDKRSIEGDIFQTTQKTEIICTITYNGVSFIMHLEKTYKNNNDLEDMICRSDITINNKLVTSTPRMSYDKGLQNKIDLWNNLSLAIRDKNDTNTKFYAIRLFNALFYDYIQQETNESDGLKINDAAVHLNNVQDMLEEPIVVEPHDDSQQQIKIVNNDNNNDNTNEIAKNITNNKKTTLNVNDYNNCLCKMCNFRC